MNQSFADIGLGLLFAAVFVYLLMVVNYQTFGDPFVVILALPATFCRILTMLFADGHDPQCAIADGCNHGRGRRVSKLDSPRYLCARAAACGKSAFEASIDAGHTKIRPVLMTAAAMIVGMIPMAIGAAGEEQNAALARAVIGGLLLRHRPPF